MKHVLSTKYTAPVPKILEVAQTNPNKAKPPDNYGWGVDPNWKAKTADEFLARAYVMAMSTKFAESHFDIGEALKQRPKWAMAVFARGYVTYLQGDIPAALLDFNEVIRQKPD